MLCKNIHVHYFSLSLFSIVVKLNLCQCSSILNIFSSPESISSTYTSSSLSLSAHFPLLQTHFLSLHFHPISHKFQFLPPLHPSVYYLLVLLCFFHLLFPFPVFFSLCTWVFPLFIILMKTNPERINANKIVIIVTWQDLGTFSF